MDRSTKDYKFLSPEVPEQQGLDVALYTKRGWFWNKLTFLLNDREVIVARRDETDTDRVSYARNCVNTRLCSGQGPVKFKVSGGTLTVEIYVDTYSYIQKKLITSPIDKYPPARFDLDWSSEDMWAVATMVLVYQLDCPVASNMCWQPRTRIHDHIKTEVLEPDDPPEVVSTISLGVNTSSKLPPPSYRKDEYERLLDIFLSTHFNSEGIPPQPTSPPVGAAPGAWQALLSEDGFYFIQWQYVLATPSPTPSPGPS